MRKWKSSSPNYELLPDPYSFDLIVTYSLEEMHTPKCLRCSCGCHTCSEWNLAQDYVGWRKLHQGSCKFQHCPLPWFALQPYFRPQKSAFARRHREEAWSHLARQRWLEHLLLFRSAQHKQQLVHTTYSPTSKGVIYPSSWHSSSWSHCCGLILFLPTIVDIWNELTFLKVCTRENHRVSGFYLHVDIGHTDYLWLWDECAYLFFKHAFGHFVISDYSHMTDIWT